MAEPLRYLGGEQREQARDPRREAQLESYVYHVDPLRDRVVPIAMLLVGGILYLVRYGIHPGFRMSQNLEVWWFLGIVILVKTAVLVGLAFVIAPLVDVGFGRIGTAALKLAAIAVFCDGIVSHTTSHISPKGMMIGYNMFGLALVALMYTIGLCYLFELTVAEAQKVVILLTVVFIAVHALLALNVLHVTITVGGTRIAPFGATGPMFRSAR